MKARETGRRVIYGPLSPSCYGVCFALLGNSRVKVGALATSKGRQTDSVSFLLLLIEFIRRRMEMRLGSVPQDRVACFSQGLEILRRVSTLAKMDACSAQLYSCSSGQP